jgi:hypothetical protein
VSANTSPLDQFLSTDKSSKGKLKPHIRDGLREHSLTDAEFDSEAAMTATDRFFYNLLAEDGNEIPPRDELRRRVSSASIPMTSSSLGNFQGKPGQSLPHFYDALIGGLRTQNAEKVLGLMFTDYGTDTYRSDAVNTLIDELAQRAVAQDISADRINAWLEDDEIKDATQTALTPEQYWKGIDPANREQRIVDRKEGLREPLHNTLEIYSSFHHEDSFDTVFDDALQSYANEYASITAPIFAAVPATEEIFDKSYSPP